MPELSYGFLDYFYGSLICGLAISACHRKVELSNRLGAGILFLTWVGFWLFLSSPVAPVRYATIDAFACLAFLLIMKDYKAIWAAVCVLLHSAMGVLHLLYYTELLSKLPYLWVLNSLFLLAVITVGSTILPALSSSLRKFLDKVDNYVANFAPNWSFTGKQLG